MKKLHRKLSIVRLDNSHDNSKYAEGRGKNLDDQDLNKQRVILSVGQGTCAASNTHGDAACDVGEADAASREKHGVASIVKSCPVPVR